MKHILLLILIVSHLSATSQAFNKLIAISKLSDKSQASSQPSIIPSPYGGISTAEVSINNSFENFQYFLYELNFDVRINKITLQFSIVPQAERCCNRDLFSIAFYNVDGDLLYKQEEIYVDYLSFPKTEDNRRSLTIKLSSNISLPRGFFWFGVTRVSKEELFLNGPFYTGCSCSAGKNAVRFYSKGSNGLPLNADKTKSKCYLLFNPKKYRSFPNQIPVNSTDIPRYEEMKTIQSDTWLTSSFMGIGFPVILFN